MYARGISGIPLKKPKTIDLVLSVNHIKIEFIPHPRTDKVKEINLILAQKYKTDEYLIEIPLKTSLKLPAFITPQNKGTVPALPPRCMPSPFPLLSS